MGDFDGRKSTVVFTMCWKGMCALVMRNEYRATDTMWKRATTADTFAANLTESFYVRQAYEVFRIVVVEDECHWEDEHQDEADGEVDGSPHEVHVVRQLHAVFSPGVMQIYLAQAMSRGMANIRYEAKDSTPI
jgi:hypothetical protein